MSALCDTQKFILFRIFATSERFGSGSWILSENYSISLVINSIIRGDPNSVKKKGFQMIEYSTGFESATPVVLCTVWKVLLVFIVM